jgi:membrane protease YdiL (CAAX protease family)
MLARGLGFWPGAILMSVVFGALHYYTKPMENLTDGVTVGLLGLFTCLTIRRTGSLWFAAGFHTAFNFTAICTLGSPNTGNEGKPIADHLLATAWIGPDWMTGGPRGLEASAFMFLTLAVLFAAFHLWTWRA